MGLLPLDMAMMSERFPILICIMILAGFNAAILRSKIQGNVLEGILFNPQEIGIA
jgi:hypothetical protein